MKEPRLAPWCDGSSALLCPECGGDNLHHERVEIFDRPEDDPSGIHTTANNRSVAVDHDMAGNPSRRRDGIVIHFTCESCGPGVKIRLAISQHKGNTFLGFMDPRKAVETC